MRLTRLSLSFGGSWGSEAELLGGGVHVTLGFSDMGAVSALGFGISSTFFAAGGGGEATLSDSFSDGATWVTPSLDFEMIATFVPGSTVSPSLATNYKFIS